LQYARTYHRVSVDATDEQYLAICLQARQTQGTVGGSVDDACIGDLDNRLMIEYGDQYGEAELNRFRDDYYPGVNIEYRPLPGSGTAALLAWPLPDRPIQTHFEDWAVFNAPRDYTGDGNAESLHEGIDIHCTRGERVGASKDGVVVWASDRRRSVDKLSRYGKHIVIDHGEGEFTWYCHLDDMLSGVGDVVEVGDGIGAAGNSTLPGLVMGVHLHFVAQIIGQGLSGYVVSDVVNPASLLGL
jgi:murein DD-endopeptidase MepM/ murein hydrolase activator NlpD